MNGGFGHVKIAGRRGPRRTGGRRSSGLALRRTAQDLEFREATRPLGTDAWFRREGRCRSRLSGQCIEIDKKMQSLLDRSLEDGRTRLWLDATEEQVRRTARIVSVPVALAVNDRGRRAVSLLLPSASVRDDALAASVWRWQIGKRLRHRAPS